MQNLKVKMLSVAIAALTAATPILSSYVAYASDITVNDDGTVTQISTSTDEKTDETKFLFVNLKTAGGKVVINEGEDSEQTVRLEKQMDRLHIDVYDKDNVMISSENAIDNGYTYVYEAKADDAVNVKAYADDGYVVKLYELTDDSSGTEIAEDVGFDAGNKVEAFKYPVFMEYDKTVRIGFEKKESAEDIAKDLSVNDKTEKDKADGQNKTDKAKAEGDDMTVKKDETESEKAEKAEDVKADRGDETSKVLDGDLVVDGNKSNDSANENAKNTEAVDEAKTSKIEDGEADKEAAQDEISSSDIDDNNVDAEGTYTINTSINQNAGMVDIMANNQVVNSVLYNEDTDDTTYDDTSVSRGENVSFRISAYAGFKISEYKLCDSDGAVLLESSDINEEDWYQTTVDCIALTDMNFSVSFVEDDSYQSDELEGRYNEVYTADTLIIGKGEEFDPESSIDDIKLYAKEGEEIKLVYSDLDTTTIGKYTTIYHITAEDDSEFFAVKRPVEVVEDPETVANTGDYQIIATETMTHGVNFDIDKQSYDEGDVVNFSVTPLNGNILNSVKAYLENEAEDTNEVFGDEIGLTKLDSKPNADDSSASEKDEALFINEDTQYYSFTMPASDVFLSFDTESGISMFADTGGTTELTKFVVSQGGPSYYYYNAAVCNRQGGTRYRTVTYKYKDENGTPQMQTVMCYCIQPAKNAPLQDGETVFSSSNGKVVALSDASRVSKVLYYGYGGPGWGKNVECSDGVTRNLKSALSRYPNNSNMPDCTTDKVRYFTLTHFLASYAYLPSHPEIWNHPLDGFSDLGPFWNGAGQAWIKNMYDELASYPKPTVMYRSKNAEITGGKITKDQMKLQSDGTYITPLIQYYTYDENTATINLPAGVTIKEKNGTMHKGKTKLTGGTYFYVIFDLNKVELPKNRTFLFDSVARYGANFQAWKILTGEDTAQDLGFAYKTGDKTIGFQIELPLPEKGSFQLGKFLYDFDNFAGKTDRDYIKTEFTIYKTFNKSESDNTKALSDVVKVVKIEDTTKNLREQSVTITGLDPGTYYLFETGRCPGSAQNLNIYSFDIVKGQTTPTKQIKNVRTGNTGTKVGNQPFRYIGMILEKVDKDGKKLPLEGAVFKVVYSENAKATGKYKEKYTWFLKTDKKGELFYDKAHWVSSFKGVKSDAPFMLDDGTYAIPSGTLYVTEVSPPDGYDIDGKTHELLMPAQKDEKGYYSIKELTATPIKVVEPTAGKKWRAQAKLKKVDEAGNGLKGAKFTVYSDEACTEPIDDLVSGDDGESNIISIKNISWNSETYTIYCKEYEAPLGYATINDKFSVTFKRADFETLYKTDENTKGKLEYIGPKTGIPNPKGWTVRMNAKKVDVNGNGLPGAEFTIYKVTGSDKQEVGKLTTGADGMTEEFSAGIDNKESKAKFLCVETKAPDGFIISAESASGYTLEFEKSAYDALHKADKNTKGELKTFGPANGIENPTPTGGITPPATPPGGGGGAGLKVIKTSDASSDIMDLKSYTLANAEFTVTSNRGFSGTLTTDEFGNSESLTLPDNHEETWIPPVYDTKTNTLLQEGYKRIDPVTTTYYITEKTPPHWHKKNNSTKTITVTMPNDANQSFTVSFEDKAYFCDEKLDIEKLGVKGETIKGAVFKVEYFDADDGSGEPGGNSDVSSISGDLSRTWYLKSDERGHVLMDNDHLDLNNRSDDFFKYDGNVVIPIGGYIRITEIAAPAEYEVDDEPVIILCNKDTDFTLTFGNNKAWYNEMKRCRVNLQKYEADGKTPIPGVEFEIKFLKQAIIPTKKEHPNFKRLLKEGESTVRHTDAEGKVFFDNLDQGTYQVTEIKTKDGNALLKEPIVFTLPFTMTMQEAQEYQNVDFSSAKEDVGYTNKWYFYDCLYEVTNNATFKMPMTGDDGKWKYGFIGLGMTTALAAVWLVYEANNKKTKKRKHKK